MHLVETKFSELEDRIDAGFYVLHKELLGFKRPDIASFELGQLVKNIFRGKSPGREGYLKKGILVLKSVNIGNRFLEKIRFSYTKESFYENSRKFNPREEEIILTSTGQGTIGRSIIFLPKIYGIDKCLVTEKVTVLRNINKQKISPYYLLAFLRSKYGKRQLEMYNRGSTGRIELYPKDIAKIVVLVPDWDVQKKIENLVIQAHQKKKLADEKYEEAEELLENELRLKDLDLSTQKTFEANFSEAAFRLDPEHFQPKYYQLMEALKSSHLQIKKLAEVIKVSTQKLDPTQNPSKKIKYIELANINSSTGEIEDAEEMRQFELPSRARMIVREGDVLVSSLSGSLDKVGLVSEELDNQVASTGFFVISSDNFLPEALFLLFRTPVLKLQLEQKTAGAIMSAISIFDFQNLLVPVIPSPIQKRITDLIQESFKLRQESKNLIEQAKQKVEKMILGK